MPDALLLPRWKFGVLYVVGDLMNTVTRCSDDDFLPDSIR